jgi:hypothetical protein
MTKMKDRQYNDQNEGQTIQWPKWGTDNTMTKMKDKTTNNDLQNTTLQKAKEWTEWTP